MKTLLTTLNAKYIHTNLALRWLYVGSYKTHDVSFKEYTIKDQMTHLVEEMSQYDLVALSTYIWNVEYHKELCALLKENKPEMIIVLGGPEVTYEPEYFIKEFAIDYVMSGEGEKTFLELLNAIESHQEVNVTGVSYAGHITHEVATVDLNYIETLDSPYALECDQEHKKDRILYFETSRGCPFMCQYCLSSLEKGLRYFSRDYLIKQLDLIFESDVKTVKLLDRSFNSNKEHALFILQYLFEHYKPGQQFQFEINADVLQPEILDYIVQYAPKDLLRFEIGIQSTYEPTNKAVKRMQNFKRLSEVTIALNNCENVDLHLDLIAGLPYESLDRFKQSFNDVFAFHAKELQLGFLKMLRGTSLRRDAQNYDYHYHQESPYEMIDNHWMSKEDIEAVHLAEDMLEKYYNSGRFPRTMKAIFKENSHAFEWFYDLGVFYQKQGYKRLGYQLDELFLYLDTYLNNREYHECLIQDYLSLFKVKPKKWYQPTVNQIEKKEIIRDLCERFDLSQELLFRYAILEKLASGYLVVIYQNHACKMDVYPKA